LKTEASGAIPDVFVKRAEKKAKELRGFLEAWFVENVCKELKRKEIEKLWGGAM